MRLLIALGALAALAGCATADMISTGDGKKGFSIACSGSADTWGSCYKLAAKSCGGAYDVIDKNQSATPTSMGPLIERNMVIQCKA